MKKANSDAKESEIKCIHRRVVEGEGILRISLQERISIRVEVNNPGTCEGTVDGNPKHRGVGITKGKGTTPV